MKKQVGAAAVATPTAITFEDPQIAVTIYVAQHCNICQYAYQVAEEIRRAFPQVHVEIVDLEHTLEAIPEIVFATPTYLLNGRVWSLGNPSPTQVEETLTRLIYQDDCLSNGGRSAECNR